MEIPPEVRYAVRDGKSIAFQRFGSGDRRLAFIPLLGNLDLVWVDAAICETLVRAAERVQCVMYDQLGTGLSDPVDHVPTIEERAADLGAVMDSAGFASATILASYDGCLGAVMFAAQHPERVEGLVLCIPFAQGWLSARAEDLVGWEDAAQVAAYERVWKHIFDAWGRGGTLDATPGLVTGRNLRALGILERAFASPAMVRTWHQIASAADVRDVLRSVQARALVLRFHSNLLPEAANRYVAELLPHGSSYEELPDTQDMGEFFANILRRVEQFMFGAPREASADRALMTVLFTDIVGSTEQAARVGDARWRELLLAHERMLRREVEGAGGRLVKLTGDGSLSTFGGPARAIRCAERIRAAASELDLRIRAGLHTGECEVIGDDIAGMAVNIAARVSAHAAGGQVLVSRTVRDLITGSGIALQPRGEHQLKGVPGSWELFAVGADTVPLPAPDQTRLLRPIDRVVLLAAQRTPSLLRAASRVGRRRRRR